MRPSYATVAEYFRLGIEASLLDVDDARERAMSIVEELPDPPADVIEVSWSRTLEAVLSSLREVDGQRDKELAGQWLLGLLNTRPNETDVQLALVVQKAMLVARAAEMPEEIYYEFDQIDDSLFLARSNAWGTVEECRAELCMAIERFPAYPTQGGA